MNYSADFWIEKRKQLWEEEKDIEYDGKIRRALAKELVENSDMLSLIHI